MRAMVLEAPGRPLRLAEVPDPVAGPGELFVRVRACGVCRTDLRLADGEIAAGKLPVVPGHQIVGESEDGRRVGIPWLGWACGECRWCTSGRENLCPRARFTGSDRDGGFAEWCAVDERFAFELPAGLADVAAAPLLCGGVIGLRALRLAGDPARLGLYGFGSAAHIVCQVAAYEGRRVFAFTRPGDAAAQALALELGAEWAGDSEAPPPEPLEAALIFAPVGALIPVALRAVEPGGSVVCAGIHMSDVPSLKYADLWGERLLRSVANLTREDAVALLELAPRVPIRTRVTTYALDQANEALADLRAGRIAGSAVLEVVG